MLESIVLGKVSHCWAGYLLIKVSAMNSILIATPIFIPSIIITALIGYVYLTNKFFD